jgi:membrane protein insertase Oxa1/YidC/SpoIIIJ
LFFAGVTWVQFIIGTTIITRLLTGLPVAIAQQRAIKRLELIQPQLKDLAEELKKETGFAIKKFGWDESTAKKQFMKSVRGI